MPTEQFEGTRYQTLIARLLLDARGALVRGELADADGTTLVRFVGKEGLLQAVSNYLASLEEQSDTEERPPGLQA